MGALNLSRTSVVPRAAISVCGVKTEIKRMSAYLNRFLKDESGATAIEYGLIAAIVGVGIVVGLTQLQGGLNTLFGNVNTQLTK
jgi:pilus assembly protein Flp/PilA